MKVAELLRKLADVIAAAEGGQETGELTQPNKAELTPAEADQTDHSDGNVFVPPLQQKLELLKKATGVNSVYGGEEAEGSDELADIKKNAGIVFTAGEDNDIGD